MKTRSGPQKRLCDMLNGNGRSPRRSFRKFSSAHRSASADQRPNVNSSPTKKRLSLKHKLPELSGSLTRVAKNFGSGLSSFAKTFEIPQENESDYYKNVHIGQNASNSPVILPSHQNSFKM